MAATDVISVAEGAAALGINDSGDDSMLSMYITGISQRLDVAVGPIVQREVTEIVDGRSTIRLTSRPVISVTSVSEDSETLTLTTDYIVDGNYVIKANAVAFSDATVVYTAGRFATTAAVEDRYKLAAEIMLRNAWRTNQISVNNYGEYEVPSQSFPTFAIPRSVKELLADEWHVRVGIA